MPPKTSHRSAFANDPSFLQRLVKQGISVTERSTQNQTTSVEQHAYEPPPRESKATTRLKKVRETNMDGRRDQVLYDSANGGLLFAFPGALLLSLNVMLRMHDAKGTGLKATWFKRVEALRFENIATIERWRSSVTFPIVVEEVYITKSNLLDNESVTAACKPVIDALVSNGILPDDSPAYIAHPISFTERGVTPGLYVRFRPSPKPWGLIDDATMELARQPWT